MRRPLVKAVRPIALTVLAVLLTAVRPVAAQAGGQSHLVLALFGGVRAGRAVWSLTGQPIIAEQATSSGLVPTGQFDTVDLARRTASGVVVGASGTYFPNSHIGFEGEIAFLGLTLESSCAIRQSQPPVANDISPELCASLQGQGVATSAVTFSLGVVGRVGAGRAAYPYARLNAGLVARTHSTIEMMGTYTDPNGGITPVTLVGDSTPANMALHGTLAAGLAFRLGTGYQLRLEGRDVITRLDRVTGRADPSSGTLALPHSGGFFHNFALTAALDVILEQSHRRRY